MSENSEMAQIRIVSDDSPRILLEHVGATEDEQNFIENLSDHAKTLLYISDELRGPVALFQGYLSMVEDGDIPLNQAMPVLIKASRDMNKKLAKLLVEARELYEAP